MVRSELSSFKWFYTILPNFRVETRVYRYLNFRYEIISIWVIFPKYVTNAGFITSQIWLRQRTRQIDGKVSESIWGEWWNWTSVRHSSVKFRSFISTIRIYIYIRFIIFIFYFFILNYDLLRFIALPRTFISLSLPIYFLMKKWIIMKCSMESESSIMRFTWLDWTYFTPVCRTVTMLLRM